LRRDIVLAAERRIKQRRNHDYERGDDGHRYHANSWRNNHIAWMPEACKRMKQLLQALVKLLLPPAGSLKWPRSSDG
jgi:hypothetical protein